MKRKRTVRSVILSMLVILSMIPAGSVTAQSVTDSAEPEGYTGGGAVLMSQSQVAVWDGVDVDVRWYFGHEADAEYEIRTPAELAGVAALANGLVNADCRVRISDTQTMSAADWNDPANGYVFRESSSDNGPNGNNLSTDTYHYGIESFKDKTVTLMADLDMGGVYDAATDTWSGPVYMPIGGQYLMTKNDDTTKLSSSFCGIFDGNGHYVRNIYCDRHCSTGNYGDGQSVGLIGRLGVHDGDDAALRPKEPTVKNVGVSGYVYGNRSVGGIVGKTGKTTRSSGDGSTGAIISGCVNYATVKNTDAKGCGGICGAFWNGGRMENCINMGNISTTHTCPTGGLGGSNENGIANSFNVGRITATKSSYAMAIGTNNGGASMKVIVNCWYLDGSSDGGGYFTSKKPDNSGAMTAPAMKSETFVQTLGDAFCADTEGIHQGYPILKWQAPKQLEFVNYTQDAVSEQAVCAAGEDGSEFTVTCGSACLVAAVKEDGTFAALQAEATGDADTYRFSTKGLFGEIRIAVARKGDVNLDGDMNAIDVSMLKAISLEKITADGLSALLSDVNQDGRADAIDVAFMKAVSLQKTAFSW